MLSKPEIEGSVSSQKPELTPSTSPKTGNS